MEDNVVLSMHGICKAFPGVKALSNVDFVLRRGEIHALMGENGAGKSTLIKVLTGVYEKDAGSIVLDGSEAHIHSPQQAQDLGISTVYQEITLCPNLRIRKKGDADPGQAEYSRPGIPGTVPLLPGGPADGGHRARRRYELQGADPRRADFLAG